MKYFILGIGRGLGDIFYKLPLKIILGILGIIILIGIMLPLMVYDIICEYGGCPEDELSNLAIKIGNWTEEKGLVKW